MEPPVSFVESLCRYTESEERAGALLSVQLFSHWTVGLEMLSLELLLLYFPHNYSFAAASQRHTLCCFCPSSHFLKGH